MKFEWSSEATDALKERYGDRPVALKLVYDAEGCGCAVSGVPALWIVDAPLPDDVRADSPVELWYEKRHEIFFDESMRIGYHPAYRSFVLSSDGQTYTNRLAVRDRRGVSGQVGSA